MWANLQINIAKQFEHVVMPKKSEASKVQSRADKSDNTQLKELARNLQSAADRQESEDD
jgi:hypothetical protein